MIKYARFDNNKFVEVEQIGDYVYWDNDGKTVSIRYDRVPIADTPQELIQVGDLVKSGIGTQQNIIQVISITNDLEGVRVNSFNSKYIVVIYTQDSNGNYIKQWEVK